MGQGSSRAWGRPSRVWSCIFHLQEEAEEVRLRVEQRRPEAQALGTGCELSSPSPGAGALGLCLDNCCLAGDPESGEGSCVKPRARKGAEARKQN